MRVDPVAMDTPAKCTNRTNRIHCDTTTIWEGIARMIIIYCKELNIKF